jgi:hypothetical protein
VHDLSVVAQFQGYGDSFNLSSLEVLEELQLNAKRIDYIPPILQEITSRKFTKLFFTLSGAALGHHVQVPQKWEKLDLTLESLANSIRSARRSTGDKDRWRLRVSFLVTRPVSDDHNFSESTKRLLPRASEHECVEISGEIVL